jgi:hypothetical protein
MASKRVARKPAKKTGTAGKKAAKSAVRKAVKAGGADLGGRITSRGGEVGNGRKKSTAGGTDIGGFSTKIRGGRTALRGGDGVGNGAPLATRKSPRKARKGGFDTGG